MVAMDPRLREGDNLGFAGVHHHCAAPRVREGVLLVGANGVRPCPCGPFVPTEREGRDDVVKCLISVPPRRQKSQRAQNPAATVAGSGAQGASGIAGEISVVSPSQRLARSFARNPPPPCVK